MRLNFRFRYTLYGAFSALFISGAFWLFADSMKDAPDGEAWQSMSASLLMVHGGAAMMTLMVLGALIPVHVLRAWRSGRSRVTGGMMVAANAILIVTAFGLYYLGSELLRPFISNVHLLAGLAFPPLLIVHIMRGRRTAPQSRASSI